MWWGAGCFTKQGGTMFQTFCGLASGRRTTQGLHHMQCWPLFHGFRDIQQGTDRQFVCHKLLASGQEKALDSGLRLYRIRETQISSSSPLFPIQKQNQCWSLQHLDGRRRPQKNDGRNEKDRQPDNGKTPVTTIFAQPSSHLAKKRSGRR